MMTILLAVWVAGGIITIAWAFSDKDVFDIDTESKSRTRIFAAFLMLAWPLIAYLGVLREFVPFFNPEKDSER